MTGKSLAPDATLGAEHVRGSRLFPECPDQLADVVGQINIFREAIDDLVDLRQGGPAFEGEILSQWGIE